MRSPAEVQELVRTRWDRSLPSWLEAPEEASVSLPLHPPSESAALADPGAVSSWIESWRSAPRLLREQVRWRSVGWRHLGTQQLPDRWEASGAAVLSHCAGASTVRDWELLSARYENAVEALSPLPDVDEVALRGAVASAVNRVRAQWLRMPDVDADLAVRAAAWFLGNPRSGLRIRQVPLPGMHSKWLKDHRALVSRLVAAARPDGSTELGLAPAPTFHDLLVLDPSLRLAGPGPGFPRASRIDVAELPGVHLTPEVVIICENSETVQVLPDLRGAVAVSGAGYSISALLAVPWIQSAPVLYWGDLDADGFQILNRARHHHPRVRSVLMGRDTHEAYRDLVVSSAPPPLSDTTLLSPAERELYEQLQTSGDRLEQERIELSVAVSALREAMEELQAE